MSRRAIIRFLAIMIGVLIAGGVGIGYAAWTRIQTITPEDQLLDKGDDTEVAETPEGSLEPVDIESIKENDADYVMFQGEKYTYNENMISCLLIGIDKDAGRNSARSDVMVLFTVDNETKKPTIIVCPRDTRAEVRHTDADGNETKTVLDKLNHSFPYGNGNNDRKMGAENVMYNLKNLLSCGGKYTDIQIQRYAGLDMQGIGPLTKAVGGVTLTMPATISGVGRKGDTVKLNENTAKTYVTTRKGVEGGSDISRGQRQMVYLYALLDQIKTITPLQIPDVYGALTTHTFTDMSSEDMVAYAKLLASADMASLFQTQLEGEAKYIDGTSFYIIDENKLEELVISTFYTKLEDKTASPSTTATDEASPSAEQ